MASGRTSCCVQQQERAGRAIRAAGLIAAEPARARASCHMPTAGTLNPRRRPGSCRMFMRGTLGALPIMTEPTAAADRVEPRPIRRTRHSAAVESDVTAGLDASNRCQGASRSIRSVLGVRICHEGRARERLRQGMNASVALRVRPDPQSFGRLPEIAVIHPARTSVCNGDSRTDPHGSIGRSEDRETRETGTRGWGRGGAAVGKPNKPRRNAAHHEFSFPAPAGPVHWNTCNLEPVPSMRPAEREVANATNRTEMVRALLPAPIPPFVAC